MLLKDAIDFSPSRGKTVAFSGGGGKSSLMYRLASELAREGAGVLVTTTTMIYHPRVRGRACDRILLCGPGALIEKGAPQPGTVTVAAREEISPEDKLKGYLSGEMACIIRSGLYGAVLFEADGARGRPVKAPGEGEPVIPGNTEIVAGVIGMDCLGAPAGESAVHRPELFIPLAETESGAPIDEIHLSRLILSPRGLFQGASRESRKMVILNKCETPGRRAGAENLARLLAGAGEIDRVIITSMRTARPVLRVIRLRGANSWSFSRQRRT